MKSYSHWGMFHCWEAPGLPPMAEQPEGSATYGRDTQQRCACRGGFNQGVGHYDPRCPHYSGPRIAPHYAEQPKSWMHVDIGTPYQVTHHTLAEALTPTSNPAQIATYWPHEDDLKLTIVKT